MTTNNLTFKFTTLSEEIEEYLAPLLTQLEAIANDAAIQNQRLDDILAKLENLLPVLQSAADCMCEAAATLGDAPWQPPVLPDPDDPDGEPWRDPASDPATLDYTCLVITQADAVAVETGFTTKWQFNLSSGAIASEGRFQQSPVFGSILLPGQAWYKVEFVFGLEWEDLTAILDFRINDRQAATYYGYTTLFTPAIGWSIINRALPASPPFYIFVPSQSYSIPISFSIDLKFGGGRIDPNDPGDGCPPIQIFICRAEEV